jgi:hypothetical protein
MILFNKYITFSLNEAFKIFKIFLNSIHIIKKIRILYLYFFFIKKKLSYQLDETNIKLDKQKKKTIIFVLIETSHPVNFFFLLIAKILKFRGYNVLALICDQFLRGCELKSIKNITNPCYECKFNQKKILPLFNMQYINLSSFDNKNLNIKVNKIIEKFKNNNYIFGKNDKFYYLNQSIKDSVTRFFYGGEFDQKYKEDISRVSLDHCRTAVYIHMITRIINTKYKPHSVVSQMSNYSSFYPLFYYFKKINKFRLINFELKNYFFDFYKFYPSKKLFNLFLKKKDRQSILNETKKVSKLLKHRFSSKNTTSKFFGYSNLNEKYLQIKRDLKINKKKINVFIFPNVFWDVGLSDRSSIFKSVLDWLFFTIDILKNNPNYHLYIKPHPDEFQNAFSTWGIKKVINHRYGNSISNISFIDNKFFEYTSYELKKFIDIALVYNGTLNLEFMLLNVPVISSGLTSTMGLNLNCEIKSKNEYKNILLNKNCDYSKFLVRDKKKLIRFAYFWFIKKDLKWNKKNYYLHSRNRFKGFNFKSLNQCNFNDEQTNLIVNFISKGKNIF